MQLWKNGDVLTLMCWSDENNVTFSTDWTVYSEGFIPLGYRPKSAMMVTNVARIDTYWKIDADTGNISKRTSANNPASNIKSWAMFTWCIWKKYKPIFSANNGNVQSNVQGWKRIYSNTSGTVTLYRNQDLFRLRGDDHSVSLTSSNAWQDRMSFAEYFKPDTIYYSITSYTNTIFCRILSSGQFQMKNTSGSSFNNPISFAILGKLDES